MIHYRKKCEKDGMLLKYRIDQRGIIFCGAEREAWYEKI